MLTKLTKSSRPRAVLRLSPYAYAKLLFLRDREEIEVSAFGITEDDPLLVVDLAVPKQRGSLASTEIDDTGFAEYFESQIEQGRTPDQVARIWIHTHPGGSPIPSGVDEETFDRIFDRAPWGIMVILDREDHFYGRIKIGMPRIQAPLEVQIDWSAPFPASDHQTWEEQYKSNVQAKTVPALPPSPYMAWLENQTDRYGASPRTREIYFKSEIHERSLGLSTGEEGEQGRRGEIWNPDGFWRDPGGFPSKGPEEKRRRKEDRRGR